MRPPTPPAPPSPPGGRPSSRPEPTEEPTVPDDDDIPMVQLLSPDGERVDHPDFRLEVSAEEVRSLYRDLVLVRRFDGEAAALQRQGELGLWTSSLGQEAAQVGSGRALLPGDHAFPTFREHGVAWCRGVDPVDLMGMFRGVNHGGWDPDEKNFHLYTIVIGAQTLHATGYAMGIGKDGADGAVIAYFGDGASSQGDVSESFTFASVFDAPVVFFCQNNQWAISEPTARQSRVPLHQRAAGFGFPGVRVDGNDVLACLAVTRWALDRARQGSGPVLIEAFTYRMGAHSTSDDPGRYRPPGEIEAWQRRDPVERVRAYLLREGWADQAFLDAVREESDRLARHVRTSVREMPDPDPGLIFRHVYAGPHPLVDEERAAYETYAAGFAEGNGAAA
nr:pyruvate dehydrogenase (acetyl-transferring) E1 component subunit alpha [Peterkaempfera bronchialis]